MKRFLRVLSVPFGALLLSVLAAAQIQRAGHYYETPGVLEFSGEMIVRPMQPDALAQAGKGPLETLVIRARASDRLADWVVKYESQTDEYVIAVPDGFNENTLSLALLQTGDYQYAEPNWTCYPVRAPNDPLYTQQWHHRTVKSPQAWDLITGLATVTCAVVDTGIDLTHPDLAPNRVPGYNSVDRLAEVDGGQVNDLNGHGTHVSGDAAAIGDNGKGVTGMGWNFRIMMVRTSNDSSGGASFDDIMTGARWAADHGAKSISASYSGVDNDSVGTTGTYIKSKGALFCYAAGNDNRDLSGINHPNTIVVGASNESDGKASFSAYGTGVHVFAPGTNILSTTLGGGYGGASGTSMATPVTNGAIALIWAMNPGLTSQQVQDLLEANCDNIGPSNIFGHGRINQFNNVVAAQALLATPVDVAPAGISTVFGTHASGSLADILVPNVGGPSYNDNSASVPKLGQAAGEELTYVTNADPTKVNSIAFTMQSKIDRNVLVTSFLYAWNYQTSKYVLIGQGPLNSSSFTTRTITVSGTAAKKYLGPSGAVKVLQRAVGARVGGRISPIPFQLQLGYAKVRLMVRN